MIKLAIIGASGHGKVVADAAEQSAKWDSIVFFDDAYPKITQNGAWPIVGNTADYIAQKDEFSGVIVAIGNNDIRLQKHAYLENSGCSLATIIHPKSIISRYASIDRGTVIFAGAIINPYAKVGSSVIVNTGATIDHDCIIGSGAHIAPGAHLAGGVTVGRGTWIGIGVSVRQMIEIGDDIVIGAGAAVVSHLVQPGVYVGIPAKLYSVRSSSC